MNNLITKKIQDRITCDDSLSTLKEGEVVAGNIAVRYLLSERKNGEGVGYEISVSAGGEIERACVGEDRKRAESFFDLLVRNSVTPCTLCDVFEDNFAL